MNAGTRKASARIHASGLAKQAAEKPNIGTNTSPMSERAIILYIELYEAAYKQLELCPYTTMPQHGRWGKALCAMDGA